MKANNYKIIRTDYQNGISCKFDNRRVTVAKKDDTYYFEFRRIESGFIPIETTKVINDKLIINTLALTEEAAEIMLCNLAELMGYKVVKEINPYKAL